MWSWYKKEYPFLGILGVGGGIGSGIYKLKEKATGGNKFYENGYYYHVFTSPGIFKVNIPISNLEYLVVAGGGGGGPDSNNGGGGAGGFRKGSGFPVISQNYTITVGNGGSQSVNGEDSIFSTITSSGGGCANPSGGGNPGGSGGGGSSPGSANGGAGNSPPVSPPQGNPGGNSVTVFLSTGAGGGGGGAGSSGTNANPFPLSAGNGGLGSPVSWVPSDYGTPGPTPGRWFAGGGGGGASGTGTDGTGGAGGGGNSGVAGVVNTGGGGGQGQPGGSGIVILRYPE